MYTHDLAKLVRLAGLETEQQAQVSTCPIFDRNWATVTAGDKLTQ